MYINTLVHVYLHCDLDFWRVTVSQDALTAVATIFGSVGVPSADSRPQDDYTTLQAQHENEWSNGPFHMLSGYVVLTFTVRHGKLL